MFLHEARGRAAPSGIFLDRAAPARVQNPSWSLYGRREEEHDVEDFSCEIPEHFLFGTVRVQVCCQDTGRPLHGVLVRIADSHEAALGKQ
jgi:hypothetical protein